MKRMPHLRLAALTGAILLSAGTYTPARAQADPDDVKRGVARISLMDGDVSVRRGDSGDWVAGVINAPLLTDDRVATGPNSRAEVQFDAANALRIGGNAEVRLAQLEYNRYQLEIAHGTVTYRVLRPTDANVEVDTPNVSVRPSKEGIYRITVNDAGESQITVRAGSVEVFTPTGSQWVNAGQSMLARGSQSDPEFQIASAIPGDDWDRWNDARDRTELSSASYQYVPPGVYGAEDLDRYGNWSNVPDYGYCWQPAVSAGWSPYSSGRWAWEDWYGWTWVSYDPWGWAPYHYGRWFHREHYGWYWYPGVRGVRHYWSPALVAFFGWGGGGVGFGFGNIGWVPLAPYEVFHPWWGRSYYGRPGYINRSINITNVNITNIYRNARVTNGITGLRGADFQGGNFRGMQRYSGNQIREAGLVRGAMPLAPGSAHLRFTDRQSIVAPRTSPNTRFFTRQQPNPVQRIPFAQQQRAFEQAGMPIRGGMATPARDMPSVRGDVSGPGRAQGGFGRVGGASPQPGQQTSGGWRRFGDSPRDAAGPRGNATPQQNMRQMQNPAAGQPAAQQNRGGWQRFGETGGGSAPAREARPSAPAAREPAVQQNRGGWQRFGNTGGTQSAPRAPERQAAPQVDRGSSRFGNPGSNRSEPRQQYTPPPSRNDSGGGSSYSPPRYSAPPRSFGGGGGGYSAPPQRSSGGGGGGFSAPRSSGGGGGGYSAPRSSGGGGGGYSAPRSSGGGGGGSSAPRSSGGGGGPRGGGGGGPRGGHGR